MHFSFSLVALVALATSGLSSGAPEAADHHRALARALAAGPSAAGRAARSLPAKRLERRTAEVSKKKGLGYNDARLTRKFGNSIAW